MDTSETYIKMCDCPEIQDGVAIPIQAYGAPQSIIYSGDSVYVQKDWDSTDFHLIWLPRQDQLQEMVWPKDIIIHASDLVFTFNNFCRKPEVWQNHSSMEQLWLAFVMKEKFNKTWNGEKWSDNG